MSYGPCARLSTDERGDLAHHDVARRLHRRAERLNGLGEWSDEGTNTRDIELGRSAIADDVLHSAGAILGGRRWWDVAGRLYDGVDGIYGGEWSGPVFVLTHRPRDEVAHDTVTFLAVPLAEAVATARTAANGKNVVIFGASLAQQCLRDGLLDEIVVHLAPVLLGDGVRLYESLGMDPIFLTRTDIAVTGHVTDLRFQV